MMSYSFWKNQHIRNNPKAVKKTEIEARKEKMCASVTKSHKFVGCKST